MSARSVIDRSEGPGGPPAQGYGRSTRILWATAALSLFAGLILWAIGGLYPSVYALYCFCVCALALALVLSFEEALVAPLFLGIVGWLVDMLPLVILVGWTAVVLRWLWGLWRERRLPRGGRFIWVPIGLVVWTAVGVIAIQKIDLKHFLLLLGIQFIASGILLAVVDRITGIESKARVVAGLALYVTVLSIAVLGQWAGLPVEDLQDSTARRAVESTYGLDAFPNSIGMIKYARSVNAGSGELARRMEKVAATNPELPGYAVFRPKFQAYENSLVVRFEGSARGFADVLAAADVQLVFDNVGLAPANTVPRLRSFPRNALTYAGVCAALFPLMLWLAWCGESRRRLMGRLGAASCLFGAGFSLARGSWIAILIAVVYLAIDGTLDRTRRMQAAAAYLAAAVVLTGVFIVRYGVDPLTGRAGGGASVATRESLYNDTLDALTGKYLILGYGTERPRLESGGTHEGEGERYVPRAGTHSTYLNYLFRSGILGMLAIALLYALAFLHARAAARIWTGRESALATLLAASVIAAAAHAVILSLYVEPTYTLTVSLLLGLAMAGTTDLGATIVPWRTSRASA